ncbi:MAG: wax ester/triacylglycerol synthase family O-acyltransferase [SAR324 cluster bacterium]|nr:wax ester/triacylglycerol synthase family O-acyltransferase [SAR324 cluster bacterium]
MSEFEKMGSADVAWLRMDEPNNLMIINSVLMFEEPLTTEVLNNLLEQRLLIYPRFRQKVVKTQVKFVWQDDENFLLDNHVQVHELEQNEDKETALKSLISQMMNQPLDPSRPLWKATLVQNYGTTGSALILRIHHCLADGIALVGVLLSLTDEKPGMAPTHTVLPEFSLNASEPLVNNLNDVIPVFKRLAHRTFKTLTNPGEMARVLNLSWRFFLALIKVLFLWPDTFTPLKGNLSGEKKVAWSKPIPVAKFKEAGNTLDAKINDLAIAAATGSIQRYFKKHAYPYVGKNVRVVVPVNLRPMEEFSQMGNRFGVIFLPLPIGVESPGERLEEVKRRMNRIKSSLEAVVSFGMLQFLGKVPHLIQRLMIFIFSLRGTAVLTNVPGPKSEIFLADIPLSKIMFWVPQSGNIGIGLSILSYGGNILFGVVSDTSLIQEPDEIAKGFEEEIEALYQLSPGA